MGASTFWHLVQNKVQSLKATLMIIAYQLMNAALSISYKVASNDGMRVSILITYRYLISSVLILPLALIIKSIIHKNIKGEKGLDTYQKEINLNNLPVTLTNI
ncbi:eamA domain, WAT1-related protein [Artemisia annua]|uniref:EamA domain, WAT1-related protein n=1 Tax=Artemisia annua TaxID=35608 RepID=A0A2U1KPQ7_ARTAN|nr:eamA domain, WAT1-related protein [Artemisia annua]